MRSNIVDIEVDLIAETDKALKVKSHITGKEAWVPKSQIEFDINDDVLSLSETLAQEKDLI